MFKICNSAAYEPIYLIYKKKVKRADQNTIKAGKGEDYH